MEAEATQGVGQPFQRLVSSSSRVKGLEQGQLRDGGRGQIDEVVRDRAFHQS